MPRKPNATRPKAKIGAAKLMFAGIIAINAAFWDTTAAISISTSINRPSQKAEKFPATKPERMLSELPPWREAVTISRVCRASVLVKNFVNSGIKAPAAVPQEMIMDNTHQRAGCALPAASLKSLNMSQLTTKVIAIETADVIQTSQVSGNSGWKSSAWLYFAVNTLSVMK